MRVRHSCRLPQQHADSADGSARAGAAAAGAAAAAAAVVGRSCCRHSTAACSAFIIDLACGGAKLCRGEHAGLLQTPRRTAKYGTRTPRSSCSSAGPWTSARKRPAQRPSSCLITSTHRSELTKAAGRLPAATQGMGPQGFRAVTRAGMRLHQTTLQHTRMTDGVRDGPPDAREEPTHEWWA